MASHFFAFFLLANMICLLSLTTNVLAFGSPTDYLMVYVQRDSRLPYGSFMTPVAENTARFLFDVDHVFGPMSFECSLDQSPWTPCASPYDIPGVLADGYHSFQVRVLNRPSTQTGLTWAIDTQPALIDLADKPSLLSRSSSTATFSFVSNEPVVWLCKFSGYDDLYSIMSTADSEGFYSCSDFSSGSYYVMAGQQVFPSMKNGRYSFEVKAVDEAGNKSPAVKFEWTVDPCVDMALCVAKECNTQNATTCYCPVSYYLDLSNTQLCRACTPLGGCGAGLLHCTTPLDSVCGDCVSSFDAFEMTNSYFCNFITSSQT